MFLGFFFGLLVVLAIIGGIWWIASRAAEEATEGKSTDPQE